MKKSELKEMIKASFLAEAEDSKKGNKEEQKRMEGAIRDDRDHIKDLEKDIKDNEAKLAKLKKDEPKDVSEEMKKDDVDEAMRGSYEEVIIFITSIIINGMCYFSSKHFKSRSNKCN